MAKAENVKAINLKDKVELVATDKAPFHKKGEVFKAHPHLADSFVKKGYATLKK